VKSIASTQPDFSQASAELPASLKDQLGAFQQHVRRTKLLEVFGLAILGLMLGFLTIFLLDRQFDTPPLVRFVVALAVVAGWLTIPWAFYRWVWSFRTLEGLASLIRRQAPSLGDELLGIIELSKNPSEQRRSPALCAAAIRQVAERTSDRNLIDFSPSSRHVLGLRIAAGFAAAGLIIAIVFPQAAWNALNRLATPWQAIDRFTFTRTDPLPTRLVVPHGEPFSLTPRLSEKTKWTPAKAAAKIAFHPDQVVDRKGNEYPFELASVASPSNLDLQIGDFKHRIFIEPKLRPELTALRASVELPAYLRKSSSTHRDVRGGSLSVVAGSRVKLEPQFNRELAELKFDSRDVSENGELPVIQEGEFEIAMTWKDRDGLTSKQPFQVTVQGVPDAVPLVSTEGLPRNAIVLNTEQLNFQIVTNDDFGVRDVGMEWSNSGEGYDSSSIPPLPSISREETGAKERLLAEGAPDQTSLHCQGTFRPIDWGIESQAIVLRAWAVDYFPDRPRAYSAEYPLLVLKPDEHAVWLTEQLSQWHRQSLDVRDGELQLYEINRELRNLPSESLASPENRKRLEEQASAESANERRLRSLIGSGESLLRQAARNPEFGVGHLERWAEMLKLLKDIGGERMPKVADLLNRAAKSAGGNGAKSKNPMAGQIRDATAGGANPTSPAEETNSKAMPKLVDRESSMESAKAPSASDDPNKKGTGAKFGLAQTTLVGPPPKAGDNAAPPPPEENKLDAAVDEQEALLAEFDRLADELTNILGELEGSTLVKRLKAASRDQSYVAQEINQRLAGLLEERKRPYQTESTDALKDLVEAEEKNSIKVSNIMDDLEAFQERRRLTKFQRIMDEMKSMQVVGALRQLGEELPKEHGMSIAQAEYWADTLDRWAEDLVDPACKGNCPGAKNNDSLPPSVVLEVLQILEGQVNLRDETRVVEQARRDETAEPHRSDAGKLTKRQSELGKRVEGVVARVKDLPNGAEKFSDEVQRLDRVDWLMEESIEILNRPETGKESLAVQTEIIELLLESKRINPKAGGGGGATPGGGGKGDTADAAIALVGSGIDLKGKTEEREVLQSTGSTGSMFPEEFRDGLNRYFQLLEDRIHAKP
jgi:hypothetical protein